MQVEALVNRLDQAKALVGLMMNTYDSQEGTLWQIKDDFFKFSCGMDLLNDLLIDCAMELRNIRDTQMEPEPAKEA